MNEDQVGYIIELLKSSKIVSPSRVLEFEGFRELEDGATRKITIRIHDNGPAEPSTRFTCTARSDTGAGASGNPMSSIETAIRVCHWGNLDK